MSVNRLAEGYHPDWDIDRAVGEQGELFVTSVLDALRAGNGEVKYDQAALKYRNAFLEYRCLIGGEWLPSGIEATRSDYWAHILGIPPSIAVVAPTSLWRAVHEEALRDGRRADMLRGSHPTQGTLIALDGLVSRLLNAHERLTEDIA